MSLAQATAGNRIVITDVNQFYNLLKGVTGSGETITLIYNAAASLVFQPSSDPAADTEAVQIKNNAGTVQSGLTFDGKFKAADGTAAAPSLRVRSEATGAYLVSAGVLGLSIAGTERARLSASGLSLDGGTSFIKNMKFVRKAANESVTSSTTLQDDDELLFAIGANEAWFFEFTLFTLGATAGDLKVAVTFPAGGTARYGVLGVDATTDPTDTTADPYVATATTTSGTGLIVGISTTASVVVVKGSIINGATPGNIQLQFAQGTSSGTATQVLSNSHLLAARVA